MTILEFNSEIRTKTTYAVPVLFGEPQYDKKKILSYSIYDNNVINELKFKQNRLKKYFFDKTNFLSRIETYNKSSRLETRVNFELIEKKENNILFRHFFVNTEVGNHGRLEIQNETNTSVLKFTRVNSFLGYKIQAHFIGNDISLFQEEHHFKYDKDQLFLESVYLNSYEMKINFLDKLANKILSQGWTLDESDLKMLDTY